ncbi:isovaleryl-CoA dehydrogenase [Azohydromonas sediminis]|uniref:isovaleryl-CoA dehydrogenase n=1 Tax=Azohydromonas sediminis TaxID=2259674 RepID=UPI000E64DD5C|nr:isovaleryl-CoA dehydrogenase [Azohydromonas sediminis]
MSFVTHDVTNQPPPLADHDLWAWNRPLRDALAHHLPEHETARLAAMGVEFGRADMLEHARLANVHPPRLKTHDRFGHRIDQVEFHPSYHALMASALRHGLHGAPWAKGPGAHVERAAAFMLFTELEPSVLCPVSMSYAVTPALRANAGITQAWMPKIVASDYDPRFVPFDRKSAVTLGMGMTEKQGGSDVRSNTTRAERDGADAWGERYRITGHKWFFSAPMCDAHLVLAQASGGLSCFFVPRILPDGSVNALRVQRLKDKLGNHANASSEVEFHDAIGWRVGDEGRGVPQILAMGALTRLDCALGTAGLMRAGLTLALHHTAHRSAFGRRLVEQPLMKNVLADLALESEAATALALRVAVTIDRTEHPGHPEREHEAVLRRVLTPIAKFWICKRGSAFGQEAMECLGGNGYVEEHGEGVMARIYREMPLNSIWEGAANIMALDLLRALRSADAAPALERELAAARGIHPGFDRLAAALPARIDGVTDEIAARALARDVALLMQASLLARHAPRAVAEAFCRARLAQGSDVFGTLPADLPFDALIERARGR